MKKTVCFIILLLSIVVINENVIFAMPEETRKIFDSQVNELEYRYNGGSTSSENFQVNGQKLSETSFAKFDMIKRMIPQ